MVEIADDELRYFVETAVRDMARIVSELGDEQACTRPDIPGANTPYALLTHCLGVIEYWAGQVNLGRDAHRDRAAEFTATGRVSDLVARSEEVLAQFGRDVAAAAGRRDVAAPVDAWARKHERPFSPGGVLLHVYEECAQHLGQLEVIRDALRAFPGPSPYEPPLDWLRRKRTVKWTRPGRELLPAWVADMDFPVAPPIRSAILGMLDRGDLGYPDWSRDPLADAFAARMRHSFGWDADPAHVRPITDLIQAVQVLLQLATEPGDGVLAHLPNYPPFRAAVTTMRREFVPIQLVPDGESWTWDADALERDAARARALLLVNPQNPTGRCFTVPELQQLADLAERHDLLVICDEIHAELVHEPHRHVPFATRAPERTVTLTSATKAYNIAGARTAVAHLGPEWLRERWAAQPPDLFGTPSTLGVEATLAAWRDCDDWLAGLRNHLRAQRDHLVERIAADLPAVRMRVPDAGYLAWLDCRALHLPDAPAAFFREHARVELAPGPDYDPAAEGWVRLNFANSRAVLDEILDRMVGAVREHRGPDAAGFDDWYANIANSERVDRISQAALGLPPELKSTSLLPWHGIADVIEALQLRRGQTLLDLACGRGGYGLEIARRTGVRLLGIDFSAVAVEHARSRDAAAEFLVGELAATGLPGGFVDAIVCVDAMQFATPFRAGVAECLRVLRPGGRLAVTGWQALDLDDENVPTRLRIDLGAELRAAGFADVDVRTMPTWREAERAQWQAAVAEDPGDDLAFAALRGEGERVLTWLDRSARVLAVARRP